MKVSLTCGPKVNPVVTVILVENTYSNILSKCYTACHCFIFLFDIFRNNLAAAQTFNNFLRKGVTFQ